MVVEAKTGYNLRQLNPLRMPTKAPKPIGEVTHYYDRIEVGVIKLAASVKLGEVLRFCGRKGEFVQAVTSLQYDRKPIGKAGRGKDVGLKLNQVAYKGDKVYRAVI